MHNGPARPRRTIDFPGLRIPPARYALPNPSQSLHLGEDTPDRLDEHFAGRLPLAALTAAEVEFLRDHFLQQLDVVRERSIAYFERHAPRRYATAAPDDRATTWAEHVTSAPHDAPSLLLLGPTGTGKTHFAYGALRAVAESGAQVTWKSFTSPDLFAHLRPVHGRDDEQALRDVAAVDLLVIDDLGAAKLSEWTEEVTFRIVNYRYEHCLPGIFTSNVPPKELASTVGGRVASRLTEMCQRITLKGDDLRKGARP